LTTSDIIPSREFNISHLGKRKIIDSNMPYQGDMLIPRRGKYGSPGIATMCRYSCFFNQYEEMTLEGLENY